MLKRIFELIAAATGLVLLSPLLAVTAVAVRCSSPGPVLFRQERVGRNGRTFVLYKFRTMRESIGGGGTTKHTNGMPGELGAGRAAPQLATFEAGNTARVTPIGRGLRRWKLDELPQLWNVLKGDMSLVGPRPEVRQWVEAYPQRWARVLTVRPGITDPASIEFRDEEDLLARAPKPEDYYRNVILPRKLDLYERYVAAHTFRGDIMILFRTIRAVLS